MEDALIYPGAGMDGSPVRQCNGVIHSFIFLDYFVSRSEIIGELSQPRHTGTGFAHHHLVGLVEFDAAPLVAKASPDFIFQGDNPHRSEGSDGVWAIFESHEAGPCERFSFLFMGTEAVQSLAALFPKHPPRALVLQEHALGGNCWFSFAEKIEELSQRWQGTPEILILGPNSEFHPWRNCGHLVGTDVAMESMHQEEREVYLLGDRSERRRMRGFRPRV